MHGIKITPLGTGWRATYFGECENSEEGIGESPIEALRLLLETQRVRENKDIIGTSIKLQVEDILHDYSRTHLHLKALTDIIGVNLTRSSFTDTPVVELKLIVQHKFQVPGKLTSNHDYIKTRTEHSLYTMLSYFNKIFAACMINSTPAALIGPFNVSINSLLPPDTLYMNPIAYRDLIRLIKTSTINVSLIKKD